MLSSQFTKLENKIEQITKISYERLRINLQSQIYQLNITLQITIKINEKARENIRKTIMEDVIKVLCEILKDNKITVDEIETQTKDLVRTELKTRIPSNKRNNNLKQLQNQNRLKQKTKRLKNKSHPKHL